MSGSFLSSAKYVDFKKVLVLRELLRAINEFEELLENNTLVGIILLVDITKEMIEEELNGRAHSDTKETLPEMLLRARRKVLKIDVDQEVLGHFISALDSKIIREQARVRTSVTGSSVSRDFTQSN